MKYNHEFTQLGKLIFEATHEYISTTTLKRMWGYINDRKSEPRITTLNLLANVAGFGSYEQFEQTEGISSNQEELRSEIFFSNGCDVSKLEEGEEVIVTW